MRKFYPFFTALGLAFGLFAFGIVVAAPPAFAQSSPTGNMQAPRLQPKTDDAAPLPPAVPGAGDQGLPTAQSVAKQQSGDPTAELFTAINANDYGSAQDAISRGADLNAQNALGETPIDLSVALNRNSITFMLLAARNDSGDSPSGNAGTPVTPTSPSPQHAGAATSSTVPVKLIENPNATPGNDPGTPNASAGFLGFNH